MSIKVTCPKCHGKKTMNDPQYIGKFVGYYDQQGNRVPQVACITCNGVGHVINRKSPYTVDDESSKKAIEIDRRKRRKSLPTLEEMTTDDLRTVLQHALAEENYERCAAIRDELKRRGH